MGYNPINYRYITNKNHSEMGLMFTNLANDLGHHPVGFSIMNMNHPCWASSIYGTPHLRLSTKMYPNLPIWRTQQAHLLGFFLAVLLLLLGLYVNLAPSCGKSQLKTGDFFWMATWNENDVHDVLDIREHMVY